MAAGSPAIRYKFCPAPTIQPAAKALRSYRVYNEQLLPSLQVTHD